MPGASGDRQVRRGDRAAADGRGALLEGVELRRRARLHRAVDALLAPLALAQRAVQDARSARGPSGHDSRAVQPGRLGQASRHATRSTRRRRSAQDDGLWLWWRRRRQPDDQHALAAVARRRSARARPIPAGARERAVQAELCQAQRRPHRSATQEEPQLLELHRQVRRSHRRAHRRPHARLQAQARRQPRHAHRRAAPAAVALA